MPLLWRACPSSQLFQLFPFLCRKHYQDRQSQNTRRLHSAVVFLLLLFIFSVITIVTQCRKLYYNHHSQSINGSGVFKTIQMSNTTSFTPNHILSQPFASNIIVSESLKIIYCPIPKAASSNWKYLIRSLEHHPNYEDLHLAHNRNTSRLRYLSDYSPNEVQSLLSDPSFFKFVFVRNPYMRLLSCYMDKFRNTDVTYIHREYRAFLAAVFSWKVAKSVDFTQAEHVPRPSFRTFVQRITHTVSSSMTLDSLMAMDAHWRPQTLLCGFGIMPFDFVGRMESLKHDVNHVLDVIGHEHVPFPTHQDLSFPPSGASDTLASQLYSTDLMFAVRALYASDFEALDYE